MQKQTRLQNFYTITEVRKVASAFRLLAGESESKSDKYTAKIESERETDPECGTKMPMVLPFFLFPALALSTYVVHMYMYTYSDANRRVCSLERARARVSMRRASRLVDGIEATD